MTEAQKYQGALYREKKGKAQSAPAPAPAPAQNANSSTAQNTMAHAAYVEDVAEDYDSWRDYEQRSDDDDQSVADPLPEAPTPPSAVEPEGHVNVFDFLVANPTPTASHVSLPATAPIQLSEDTQLVRFDPEANGIADTFEEQAAMVQYGAGPVPTHFETPAPKAARRKVKDTDKEAKKDKKRKRLHIETDHIMTDAPPVLHSGLTGGMNRLMSRPTVFPPSPDYSGGDVAETPASPLKKTKSKHHKSSRATETLSNSLMAMIAAGSKPKASKKRTKTKSSSTPSKPKKKRTAKTLEAPKEQKLLEFRPGSKDGKEENGALVVYKPPAQQFLSFVTKGPESERGCSVNKALKRYHRERSAAGSGASKLMDEKELWRSLRMKKNDRGEIVLFCIDD
jgi:cell growth-regulating nucleolar protein